MLPIYRLTGTWTKHSGYDAWETVQVPTIQEMDGCGKWCLGHYRGNIDWTLPWHEILHQWNGLDAFKDSWDSWNANLGLKCAHDTIGTWPIVLHCYQTTAGSNGFCIGTLVGADGLDARSILGTTSLQISAASKIYLLRGRWLLRIRIFGVQYFLNF